VKNPDLYTSVEQFSFPDAAVQEEPYHYYDEDVKVKNPDLYVPVAQYPQERQQMVRKTP
jgi:hypothetical protein